jgi:hypothetical protein
LVEFCHQRAAPGTNQCGHSGDIECGCVPSISSSLTPQPATLDTDSKVFSQKRLRHTMMQYFGFFALQIRAAVRVSNGRQTDYAAVPV